METILVALDEEIDRLTRVRDILYAGSEALTRKTQPVARRVSEEGRARMRAAQIKRWANAKVKAKKT